MLKFCEIGYFILADDLQLYVQCPSNMLNSAIAHQDEDIIQAAHWPQNHGLSLNPSKTKAIIFGSLPYLAYICTLALLPLLVSNQPIEFFHQMKWLGVILNADLT